MSVPPQFIRVKRKRDDESPVTFLQFDESIKRQRSGTHWVYQRREPTASVPAPTTPLRPSREPQPVIHVSSPGKESPKTATQQASPHDTPSRRLIRGKSPARIRKRSSAANLAGPRRFHLSRANLAPDPSQHLALGAQKRPRAEPTIFVERSRRKLARKDAHDQGTSHLQSSTDAQATDDHDATQERPLKKPGVSKRPRPEQLDSSNHFPLPTSFTKRDNEDLDKITADMNEWVMNELGANLHAMDQEKSHAQKPRFKPKAPSKRYQERHPETNQQQQSHLGVGGQDTPMAELSEEDGDDDDWVIDEYVRVPADSMALDVAPTDVGFLVLEGDEENTLFFGPERDEEDDYLEDEDDENAENHYTADYPEDEVDSDDEFDRHPYMFRNENASDEEEFDNRFFDENDDDEMVLEGDDDDATMARIRTFMRRKAAFR